MTTVKSYRNYSFSSGVRAGEDFLKFQRLCKSSLVRMCKPLGINLHTFNKGHYYFSAVLERDGRFIYVSISDVRYFDNWYDTVLVRTMKHDRDWTGGPNNYTSWNNVGEMADSLLKRLV